MPPKLLTETKCPEPDRFDGSNFSCRQFLLQLKLVFSLNPNAYPTDHSKSLYLMSLLKGPAFEWASTFLEKDDPILDDYESFTKTLSEIFEEPDRVQSAMNRLSNLHQGSDSAAEYTSKFKQLACSVPWDELALTHQFRLGLNGQIKDFLATHDLPTTLQGMITLAIRIDQRLTERERERALEKPLPSSPPHQFEFKAKESSKNSSTPVEIPVGTKDISEVWSKLSPRQQRYLSRTAQDLCVYCGTSGHQVSDCPKKKPRGEGKEKAQFHQ